MFKYEYNDGTVLNLQTDPSGCLAGGVGATVWDSALQLVKWIETPNFSLDFSTCLNIIDIGSGTGIVGLFLAKYQDSRGIPAKVYLTDRNCALPLLEKNIEGTQVDLEHATLIAQTLEWGCTNFNNGLKGDLILLSDCVVWPELFEPLIDTLDAISDTQSIILLSYEKRKFDQEARFFYQLSHKFRFSLVKDDDLDQVFRAEDIFIFRLYKK